MVSPANSFGFMDGGIDAHYLRLFGHEIQNSVQDMIRRRHHGELLVGVADIVETGHAAVPYLIIAPTMRVPMVLKESANAYLAERAVFTLLKYGRFPSGPHRGDLIADHIRRLAQPGLGTGVGRMGPNVCARQVRAAIDDMLLERFTAPGSWAEASERHQLLYAPLEE